jgi:DUF1009 family protein
MIGVFCGSGDLPLLLIEDLKKNSVKFKVFIIQQIVNVDEVVGKIIDCNIEKDDIYIVDFMISKIIKKIKNKKINEIIFVGYVKMPHLRLISFQKNFPFISFNYKFDLMTIKLLLRILKSKMYGDNSLINCLISFLEEFDIKILNIKDIAPSLINNSNINSINENLSKNYSQYISFGLNLLDDLSKYDVGQGIVIWQNRVVGIEGIEGTDELINRCGNYYKNVDYMVSSGVKMVLIKQNKKNQNTKIDFATIGADTIHNMAINNFCGLVISVNNVLIINKEKVIELIKNHKMFLINSNN